MTERQQEGGAQPAVIEDGEAAERLVVRCRDCHLVDPYPNTKSGFRKAKNDAAEHVDDGAPCEDTQVFAVFDDGSEMYV